MTKVVFWWPSCRTPDAVVSVLGMAGPVSVYIDRWDSKLDLGFMDLLLLLSWGGGRGVVNPSLVFSWMF